MDVKYFGRRLMRVRKNRGMNQTKLAELTHTSVSTLSRYENGLGFPSERRLYKIANILNVDVDWLLTGSN